MQSVATRKAAYDDAVETVEDRLKKDPGYRALLDAAVQAEARVKILRANEARDELPDASRAWIATKNELEIAKARAIAADVLILDARKALALATSERDTKRHAFEAILTKLPGVVEIATETRRLKAALDIEEVKAEKSQSHLDVAERTLSDLQQQVTDAQSKAKLAISQADQYRREQTNIKTDISAAVSAWRNLGPQHAMASNAASAARSALDAALARQREREAEEQRKRAEEQRKREEDMRKQIDQQQKRP